MRAGSDPASTGSTARITVQQLAAHTAGEDADHLAQIARMIPA